MLVSLFLGGFDVSRTAESYLNEAALFATQGNVLHAIWLTENAFSAATDAAEAHRIESLAIKVTNAALHDAISDCSRQLKAVSRMLSNTDGLVAEEWMLIVSTLSSAYALTRFVKRTGRKYTVPVFDTVIRELQEATDNFTHATFLRQLRAARRRYPNPLPPPLEFRQHDT